MNNITDAPQLAPGRNATPIQALTEWLSRTDFASNALTGIPVDYWETKLGKDAAKWPQEGIDIRIAFEKQAAAAGWQVNLATSPQTVYLSAPRDGASDPVAAFFDLLWNADYMRSRGGVSPAVNRLRQMGNGSYGGSGISMGTR